MILLFIFSSLSFFQFVCLFFYFLNIGADLKMLIIEQETKKKQKLFRSFFNVKFPLFSILIERNISSTIFSPILSPILLVFSSSFEADAQLSICNSGLEVCRRHLSQNKYLLKFFSTIQLRQIKNDKEFFFLIFTILTAVVKKKKRKKKQKIKFL